MTKQLTFWNQSTVTVSATQAAFYSTIVVPIMASFVPLYTPPPFPYLPPILPPGHSRGQPRPHCRPPMVPTPPMQRQPLRQRQRRPPPPRQRPRQQWQQWSNAKIHRGFFENCLRLLKGLSGKSTKVGQPMEHLKKWGRKWTIFINLWSMEN